MAKVKSAEYAWNRKSVEKAFDRYRANEPEADEALYNVVFSFAKNKAIKDLYDIPEVSNTPDDVAQDVVLYVWRMLPTFQGDASAFYSVLNRASFTTGADAVNAGLDRKENSVDLMVVGEDGSLDDNPVLYSQARGGEHTRALPDWIQGEDREICELIRDGEPYSEIAVLLGMTPSAVESRVRRMRLKKEKLSIPGE